MEGKRLTHLSLFSGIGGLDLAAEWAGFTTVGQCEWADYPTKVLEKHWPNVPRWRDIRTLNKESFYEHAGLRTVDIISGGFPCQPFSVAGNQKGKGDDRYLWPEMLRVIRELSPRWVLGENVPGIIKIAGRTVCEDLERAGYAVAVFNFEAAAVGALHRRERVFFVANRNGDGSDAWRAKSAGQLRQAGAANGGQHVADANGAGLQRRERGIVQERAGERLAGEENSYVSDTHKSERKTRGGYTMGNRKPAEPLTRHCSYAASNAPCAKLTGAVTDRLAAGRAGLADCSRWHIEPGLGGVADGAAPRVDGHWLTEPDIPRVTTGAKNRVNRLKCLGNAVVPQQAYPMFAAIAAAERNRGAN